MGWSRDARKPFGFLFSGVKRERTFGQSELASIIINYSLPHENIRIVSVFLFFPMGLVSVVLFCQKMVHYVKFAIFLILKVLFAKNENMVVSTFYLRNNLLSPQVCIFISCYGNCYHLGWKILIQLINTPSFKSNGLLFLKRKCHKGFFLTRP